MSEPSVPEQAVSEETIPLDESGSVVLVQVGDRQYSAKHVAQCKVCRSKHRHSIEQGIISGMSYPMVMREIVDPYQDHSLLGAPTLAGLYRHGKQGHMPIPYVTQRKIIEERAREIGKSVETGEQLVTDAIAILRTITQRGFERVNTGEIQPNMTDLMTALKLQQALTPEGGEAGNEDLYVEALYAYMEVVEAHVDHPTLQAIGRDLERHPAIKALSKRRQTVAGEIES